MTFRSCIGCKVVSDKKDLLRLVFQSGRVVVDRKKSCPGRGAYVHPKASCVRKSLDSKILAYRLRIKSEGIMAGGIELGELKILFAELQLCE